MFIGTSGSGVIIKFKNEDIAVQIPTVNENGSANLYSAVQALHIDKQKHVWIFIAGTGLHQYNYKTKRLEAVDISFKHLSVNKLLSGGNGDLWLGASTGLFRYSVSQKVIAASYTEVQRQLSANYVSALSLDHSGNLWIGTDGGGVDILDTRTGHITNIDRESKSGMLSSKTNKGGVNVFDVTGNVFNTISRGASYPGLSNNFITSFFEDQRNRNV